jgi:hypothetical protein
MPGFTTVSGAADPFFQVFGMRPVPVQLPAWHAPEKCQPGSYGRGILRSGNFFYCRLPKHGIAQRAPAHQQPAFDELQVNEPLHLYHHILLPDQDGPVIAAPREFRVSRKEYPILPFREIQKERIFPSIALSEIVCADGIISHEPQVPGERPEHTVNDKTVFGGRFKGHAG